MAPERLLVFEVRGSVSTFANAIRKVPGLELIDEEELEADEQDKAPEAYLLVPDAEALRNILSLWNAWVSGRELPTGFTPWRDVFATLRELRVWGPADRIQEGDRQILADEIADLDEDEFVSLEIELVFRVLDETAAANEEAVVDQIEASGGAVLSRCRIIDIAYHALLATLPVSSVREIVERTGEISSMDPVMHIRPQSITPSLQVEDAIRSQGEEGPLPDNREPILALLDGVPVSEHRLLRRRLNVDDQFDLEPITLVAERTHGTAMASLIVYGDRNLSEQPLPRRLHCVPVLGPGDQFPEDRLIVDLIYQAVTAMRREAEPTAPSVIIVNLSLGNARKPFQGKLSPWGRLIDRLSHQFGLLFCVSAGNHAGAFAIPPLETMMEYEALSQPDRAQHTLSALSRLIGSRRLLAPAESVNGVTVGAANLDAVSDRDRRAARVRADPYHPIVIGNPSSALGPGFANSVKPDVLLPGSREHLIMVAAGDELTVRPSGPARPHGLKVAAPPSPGARDWEHYTSGTSAAAALASRTAHRIHDALEETYGSQFLSIPSHQRAVLLKALLVHTAAWPQDTASLIRQVLGPADPRQSVRQKDNIRRFLGFGVVSPEEAIYCAADRATFWSVGTLAEEARRTIRVPLPNCMSGKALPHSISATLAWFTPVRPGRQSYRTVRLRLLASDEIDHFRVSPSKTQPDANQAGRGTVFSRRWEGNKAPALTSSSTVELVVQREPDRGVKIDEHVPFGLGITVTMPSVVEIYDQARAAIALRPSVRARVR